MAKALTTAGMTLQWAVEQTKGTRPTTGYKIVPDLKSLPAINSSREAIDSTTLQETEYKTSVAGLKEAPGSAEFTANLTEALITAWDEVMEAYETASADGKAVWFTHVIPDLPESTYYIGEPDEMGTPGGEVGAILEISMFITVNNAPAKYAKPTATAPLSAPANEPMMSKSSAKNTPVEV